MPAEPTKAKLKRRSSRKDLDDYRFDSTHARELELKRNRECRRLKIKCDKQIPCQSCQRRGCAALCPNGSLATGQGTRFVLAATEHLHRRISKLSGRIRQLEDALASLQAQHSSEPHPLLHEDLISDGKEDEGMVEDRDTPQATLPAGASLLLANTDSAASPESIATPDSLRSSKSPSTSSISADLTLFSHAFPFTPVGAPSDIQKAVESHLPAWDIALGLCSTYFDQVSWLFRGVSRQQLIDDMLPTIYGRALPLPGEDYSSPHDLSLLFSIFAIGSLVAPEPSNAQGEHYMQIAKAALGMQPVLEKPSLVTIQTLHLMSIYNAMSGSDLKSETSMEVTWSLVTLASHLSMTIGLHRDSERWGLSAKMVQRRRVLFWDLFVADVWQSLNTGRPPSFSLAYIDCSFPQYPPNDKSKEGGFGAAFEIWQFKFAAECVADVTARTLTAEAPSYATIMELDRKVREFPLPEGMELRGDNDMAVSFQKCVLDHIRETVLMYIHRSFFAQAIIEHPINPLKSTYAPSFLAAYRASSTILKSVREQFNIWPNSCSRFWTMWTFAFSAAVVFGTVVTRGPRSPLAQSAMTELDQACVLFSKAALYSIRATKALPILTKLSEKARYALAAAAKDPSPLSGDNGGILWNIKQEDTEDELSILAGHTRFISKRNEPVMRVDTYSDQQHHQHQQEQRVQLSSVTYHGERHPSQPVQLPISTMQPGWTQREEDYMNEDSGPAGQMHYRYVPSERAMQQHQEGNAYPGGWSSDVRQSSQVHQQQQRGPPPSYVVPSQGRVELSHGHGHYPQSQYQHPHQHHQAPLAPPSLPQLHLPHPSQQQQQQQGMYAPAASGYAAPANSELADLGLASRDSRLDERWSSFMADSGLLDDIGTFRGHH
ncbi:fungal-specific transcription factor domain-containing protein [Cyathus striatus]|nr:fungal-specific transcription factor domain-containing protein [Cyathus striatus]